MSKAKILIVDDQWTNISYLQKLLKDYDVIDAYDGRSALKKIAEEKPDLILMDVMMPGVDGYSVLSVIRNASETRLVPVILITSLSGVDEKIKSLEEKKGFFTKVFLGKKIKTKMKEVNLL